MTKTFKILTILGSPHDGKSNTRALVEDFVAEVAAAGLPLEHRVIPLGRTPVLHCEGCWACTKNRPCPQSKHDDLDAIKAAMLGCDMLILASPVYVNQVSAQMKALLDRLFTWCHVFPLLGKYSLSACTTGNDGQRETGEFLEKMLATYGTSSFGTLCGTRAATPGFFPGREAARTGHRKLASKVAATLRAGKALPVTALQRR
ncbi:MAG: flavodoxin family protein, partial [Deltaproteobacteria bacterium]|nr:flavodoxin family protein [Deltaproteobacteria bacterium]MBW2533265.1 flavodoxin family protein [Deltaproteobacteria bacterium]